jgi:DNA helicase-2/ATP-dependent DNA helicase PcrA
MLPRDRPNTRILRLEQNYRSTQAILDAANRLIEHNQSRLGKKLWTHDKEGEPVQIHCALNEVDEARFVAERIHYFVAEGRHYSETAILYRTTAQSQLFEEALNRAAIPYRVYGGVKFFERAEIKDAIAYLRLIANPNDDVAFERAVSTPPRGIGGRTIEILREQGQTQGLSLWQTAKIVHKSVMPARSVNALVAFIYLIDNICNQVHDLLLDETIAKIIELTGLITHYENIKDGSGPERVDNLFELINTGRRFNEDTMNGNSIGLSDFLTHVALESGDTGSNPNDTVQLMTLHAAKGLEFPVVFVAGMEEGLFPHQMCKADPVRLEEERRLCYVGMTRAMQRLYMTYAETRRMYSNSNPTTPSRFINEIKGIKPQEKNYTPLPQYQTTAINGLRLGIKVLHPVFGEGVILNLEGQGNSAKAEIKFKMSGIKRLLLSFANLQLINK